MKDSDAHLPVLWDKEFQACVDLFEIECAKTQCNKLMATLEEEERAADAEASWKEYQDYLYYLDERRAEEEEYWEDMAELCRRINTPNDLPDPLSHLDD